MAIGLLLSADSLQARTNKGWGTIFEAWDRWATGHIGVAVFIGLIVSIICALIAWWVPVPPSTPVRRIGRGVVAFFFFLAVTVGLPVADIIWGNQ
jgi:hypothetical protein